VHETLGVGGCQPSTRVHEARDDGLPCGLGRQPRRQRLADDELHRHEDPAVVDPDIVHGDDVGMRELGHGLCLADEPRVPAAAQLSFETLGQQHLQGDLSIEVGIEGGIYDAHAARADAFEDVVPTHSISGQQRRHIYAGRSVDGRSLLESAPEGTSSTHVSPPTM